MQKVSAVFAGYSPSRRTLVHYPERARDQQCTDPLLAWKKVLWPFFGSYMALMRRREPVVVITDSQLEEGIPEETRVLVVPVPEGLTNAMRLQVEALRKRGGLVIGNPPGLRWYDQADGGQKAAFSWLEKRLSEEGPALPFKVVGGPEALHVQYFVRDGRDGGRRLRIAFINDFSKLEAGYLGSGRTRQTKPVHLAPPCQGVRLVYGKGRGPRVGRRLREQVSGRELRVEAESGGRELRLPEFKYLAILNFEQ